MRRYLLQLATFLAPRSVEVADSTLRQLARWLTDQHRRRRRRRDHPQPHRGLQGVARRPARHARRRRWRKNTQRQRLRMIRIFFERIIEWDWPDAPGRNPILARRHPTPPRTAAEVPRRPRRRPAHGRRPRPPRSRATGSSSRCSPAPGCAPASCATSPPTPSPRSATPTGCASRSASSATTATSRCTPTSSTLLAEWTAANADHIRRQRRLHRRPPRPARPTHRAPHRRPRRHAAPGSATSTPTSCATPWPPKPSTAACASKRSPRCSATARWR